MKRKKAEHSPGWIAGGLGATVGRITPAGNILNERALKSNPAFWAQ